MAARQRPDGPLRQAWTCACQMAGLMVGLPDYDAYVAHRQANHPGLEVMTRAEFVRERQAKRYGGGPGAGLRCC
ncbi:YbdD/YjiX family protein [Zavarzinia sp. CC-PAN008]|uniref:YbdD/YjiX family protein n=1 Tax=Zavarzinia sp. CC-PAN008 TaxID=3243332 RepID=UPI003F743A92